MSSRVFLFVLSVLSVLSVGCGQTVPENSERPAPAEPNAQEGTIYQNTRFGYRFTVPGGALVYALNLEDQTARLAEPEDEVVFVPEQGTNVLTVRGIEGAESPHTWLTQHVSFFYPQGEAAQRVETLDGQQALSLYGEGTSDSPARLTVVQPGAALIVVTFEQETEAFESILASFDFIP
ncbi:hypothetical protein HY631_01720 [Candidatus Uhrbacteria bacterium]|nr:hypothetical protein [Candidatus Uhrbacteria bacterium]